RRGTRDRGDRPRGYRSGGASARRHGPTSPGAGCAGTSRRGEREGGALAARVARALGRRRAASGRTLRAERVVKRVGQALVAGLAACCGWVARAWRYGWALAWGRAAGRAACALGIRRDVVHDNLARAYPEWSGAQVHETARRTYEIWGQVFVDL